MADSYAILLVEDDEVDRLAVRRALRSAHAEICEADTCRDAFERLRSRSFDCILLDYRLPDGDGLSFLGELRTRGSLTPAIVLTGQGDEETAVELMKAGAIDYIPKSRIAADLLVQSLLRAIRVGQAERLARRATEELQASEERYRLVLEGSNEGFWDWRVGTDALFCNPRLREMFGLDPSSNRLPLDLARDRLHPEDRPRLVYLQTLLADACDCRNQIEAEFRICHPDGSERFCIVRGKAQCDAADRVERLSGVAIAITERRRREARSHFLAEASKLLVASLDPPALLGDLADLAVAQMADWCAIDLYETDCTDPDCTDPDPTLTRVAAACADPERTHLVRALARYLDDEEHLLSPRAARTGTSHACFAIAPADVIDYAAAAEQLSILRQLGCTSVLCVPLLVGERSLGAMTLVCGDSGRRYTRDDLMLAEDLAQRVALALDNGRLYEEATGARDRLGRTLQTLSVQQRQLRALQGLTNLLNQRLTDLPALLRVMVEATSAAIADAQTCFIALYRDDRLQLTAAAGDRARELDLAAAFDPDGGVLHRVFATVTPDTTVARSGTAPVALFAVPIASARGGSSGILAVGHWGRELSFSAEDRHLLAAVGKQAAIAIENARLIETLEEREARLEQQNQILGTQNSKLARQQQQIQLQNVKLLEAARLKSQFIATMSHELRTPMNAIIGFSQLLLRHSSDLSASRVQMIERILSNGKALLALIDDILDLSKVEAGRLELRLEPVDLVQLACDTLGELQSLADEKRLTLELDARLHDPTVVGDRVRLRQILVNLLSNALKFTERGSVRVELNEADSEIEIAVSDTGIGISPDQQEHIFDEFRQLDQTTTRKYSGTGLGLAIARSLVELMRGQIEVESELGQGSTFRVTLPRYVEALPLSVAVERAHPPTSPRRHLL